MKAEDYSHYFVKMTYNPKDYYFKKAKQRHFAARSVFKLEELDLRFKLIHTSNHVLDLGCAPGSWSQYASAKVGSHGRIIGVDLKKVQLTLPNTTFIQADILNLHDLAGKTFDVVMSDMAPQTTGIRIQDQQRSFELCSAAIQIAEKFLKPEGNFVVKFFHSEEFKTLMDLIKKRFKRVEVVRPKSTRKESKEIYLIGLKKI